MMANVSWFQERTSLSIPERSPRWGRSTPIRRDSSTSLVASDDLEKQSNVYFIDLWALRTHQLKANDHVHVVGSSYDEITLFALDQDEKIKVYDFVGLQKKEFFDYEYFLTSADEMNLIIKGYQDLPVQEAYAPQRMNEQKITNDLLPITSFFDPPVDFVLSKDYAFFIYKKKVIIYRRSELLTLGKLKDFDKMKASRSQFNYIVWEFEIGNKQVQRAYLTKDDSLVLLLDTFEYFTVSQQDLKLLGTRLAAEDSVNLFYAQIRVNKMKETLTMNVVQKPVLSKFCSIPGISKGANIDLIYTKERGLFVLLQRDTNAVHVLKVDSDTSGQSVLFSKDGDDLKLNQEAIPAASFNLSNSMVLEQAEVLPLIESLPRMISPHFRRLISEDTFMTLLTGLVAPDERPTAYVYGTLANYETYLILGTNKGSLILLKLFSLNNEHISLYFSSKIKTPIKSIELFSSHIFISNELGEVVTLNFNPTACTEELRRLELKKDKTIKVIEIPSSQLNSIDIPSKLKSIIPLIYLGEVLHPFPEMQDLYNNLIGLNLENNLLVLFDQKSLTTIFEHQYSESLPIGLYFDQKSEFLNILYDNGDIDVFNVNIGNIIMLIHFRSSMAERYNQGQAWPEDVVYQMKIFSSHCFTYERSTTIATQFLNLVDMLKDYKNTFVNLHSFSNFAGNPLINVTQNGSIFEFATQFYTNELITTHIEYQKLKKGAITNRPTCLVLDEPKKKEVKEVKKVTIEDAFQNITSLKDLNMLVEQQMKDEKEHTEEKTEAIPIENIPVKLQNILERNQFSLVKERLMDHPLQLLDYYEKKGKLTGEDSKFSLKDILRILTDLNYANFEIFSDPEAREDCVIIKKIWQKKQFYILNFYPAVYEIGNANHNMLISTVLFPSGIDMQSELEFKAAFGDGFPTIEFAVGVQGIAESFSFVLNDHFIHVKNQVSADIDPNSVVTPMKMMKDVSFFTVSNYVTTSMLLGVVAELIYILKKGYQKVQPLINAIRTMYFEKMVNEIKDFQPVSQKILTLLTLNDKLLVSASSHFILNNIYDKKKVEINTLSEVNGEFIDKRIVGPLSFYWLQIKNSKGYYEAEPLSILAVISKFELFVISMMLYHLKLGGLENSSIPLTREQVINLIHPVIEIKISLSYPFLVIPVIKICLETLPVINIRNNQKIIRKLFHSVAYFSLYYGLTFEPDDQENPTYVNSELLQDDNLPSAKQLKGFVANLRQQSYEVRRGIRVHILKLLKLLGELDVEFILFLMNEMIGSNDATKLVAYNVVDICKYMIKFCEADFNSHIVMWSEILMK